MSESDLLCRMFQAWRDDHARVPNRKIRQLPYPLQITRGVFDLGGGSAARTATPVRRVDGGW
ncbi:hypothetical protein ACFXPA_14610 [Amycolatopsis sp. NPDC059090]|uniref:hypothetical protein n=1 Tax=Amycolatopsis sp. NPDC059090 TaxID=3346723 RepID=UPI00366FE580